MAVTSFAISAASTVSGFIGAQQAAADQNEMYRDNARNANEDAKNKYVSMQQRMMQEQAAAAQQKQEAGRDARAARATALVAAGESGVAGNSIGALMQEFYGREAAYNDSVDANTEMTLKQMNAEMKGIKYQTQDRINSVARARPPSFFDAGLRIAGAGFDAYKGYKER